MKRILSLFIMAAVFLHISGCAVTGGYQEEPPQEGKSILVGAILVENFGLGDIYDSKKSNIIVKLSGKHVIDGEEVIRTYRTTTDPNGYYMIQNVEPGYYIIKGLEMSLVPNERYYVHAIWDGERRYYELTTSDMEGDYTVRYWEQEYEGRVIDMGIMHFEVGITSRGHMLYNRFTELQNARLRLPGITYNMQNPVEYYEERFPEWEWFQSN
ncbi:MAG: hypothetical protein GF372_00820 [Candidatus Marinimicrobia bacterium]|nr:hypothetical protein [Candidatus Neomarinimicrobiota bacterium]